MGCSTSTLSDVSDPYFQDKLINDAIEQSLQLNKQQNKNGIKLLLLGTGESGKSTVLKQMKLLHKGGFTQQERLQYSNVIWCDIIQQMKILIIQGRKFKIPLDCDQKESELIKYKHIILRSDGLRQIDTGAAGGNDFLNDYIIKYSETTKNKRKAGQTGITSIIGNESEEIIDQKQINEILNQTKQQAQDYNYTRYEIAEAISKLWTLDKGIQKVYTRSNEFQFESSSKYYFENIFKFANKNYLSSDQDILNGRIKTTGITKTNFLINSFQFKVLDAGGQRSERKKWIHCFQDITCICFVLAVSEYDQMLFEDETVNRMKESIILFDTLCNSKWFQNTPFILFLNKIDLFKEKLTMNPLGNYFSDYKGGNDFESAIKFFESNFTSLNRSNRPIYIHRTCATDQNSMKFVLNAVTDLIIQQNLKKSGMM
ncbi:unnamed protein product [Candida verbasci]|uniref:Guanine nucleotide-binding protein alpha-1 subunit n=1 Tax=Candida verbasci TaxID=1227364 RepID=A0A9W4TYJ9_9ASCO|nr:unnamed protein product [Candida verbasci]